MEFLVATKTMRVDAIGAVEFGTRWKTWKNGMIKDNSTLRCS